MCPEPNLSFSAHKAEGKPKHTAVCAHYLQLTQLKKTDNYHLKSNALTHALFKESC